MCTHRRDGGARPFQQQLHNLYALQAKRVLQHLTHRPCMVVHRPQVEQYALCKARLIPLDGEEKGTLHLIAIALEQLLGRGGHASSSTARTLLVVECLQGRGGTCTDGLACVEHEEALRGGRQVKEQTVEE